MRHVYINELEKLSSDDHNNMQTGIAKAILDDLCYNLFEQTNGCIKEGLKGSYVNATTTQVAAGIGFFYDSSQTGYEPKFRPIIVDSAQNKTHAAADPTNPRYDLVVAVPNFETTGTASRYVKDAPGGEFSLETVDKDKRFTYTLTVVTGTPAGSPAVPATPAGSIPLYKVLVEAATGIAGASSITDLRTILPVQQKLKIATVTATYAADGSEDVIEATSGTFTVTLYAVASFARKKVTISNLGSGVITISPNINGVAWTLEQNESITVYSNGTTYQKM